MSTIYFKAKQSKTEQKQKESKTKNNQPNKPTPKLRL